MGYTTTFDGEFNLDKPLTKEHKEFLTKFSETRRVKRDEAKASKIQDPVREAAGLSVGKEGAYFTGGKGSFGQEADDSVIDYNYPPAGQPSLWCEWIPNEDGTAIVWDEGEKFYEYTTWIKYLIENFLKPWGYTLNGSVDWDGEESEDTGTILIEDNIVEERDNQVYMSELNEGIDEILKRAKDRIPLFMNINDTIDKKIKKVLSFIDRSK